MRALPLLLLIGCQGELVTSAQSDAQPDAACATTTGDLVVNGSFETWTGAAPTGWIGQIKRSTGAAFHCATAVVVESPGYRGAEQSVALGAHSSTEFEVSAATRWVSGPGDATAFNFYFYDVAGTAIGGLATAPMPEWRADGAWHQTIATVPLPANTARITLYVVSQIPAPQSFELDQVTLRLR